MKIAKLKQLSTALLLGAFLWACDDGESTAPFQVIGDVFVVKKQINGETRFARAYYAYGTYPITSAEVLTPDQQKLTLLQSENGGRTHYKEPANNDFTTNMPPEGTYTFSVINEEIKHTATDILNFSNMDIATIGSTSYNQVQQVLTVNWDAVENAESYLVKLVDSNGNTLFLGTLVNSSRLSYVIGTNTGAWTGSAESGKSYTLQVLAFKYEDAATSSNYQYNIEEATIAEKDIIWGEPNN